jgi:hypothetical protein
MKRLKSVWYNPQDMKITARALVDAGFENPKGFLGRWTKSEIWGSVMKSEAPSRTGLTG